jgi:hypothetical protein
MNTNHENQITTHSALGCQSTAISGRTPLLVVDRLLREGETLALAANPKCHKSWALCDLALSVASGTPWLGFQCAQRPVLLVDLHMDRTVLAHRIDAICREKQLHVPANLAVWPLRGQRCSLGDLLSGMANWSNEAHLGLVIIDPFFKLACIGGPNNRTNSRKLALALEEFSGRTQTTLAWSTDLPKGTGSHAKKSAPGADAEIALRPFCRDHYQVSGSLQNLPPLPGFKVHWKFPLLHVGEDPKLLARLVRPAPGRTRKDPSAGAAQAEPTFPPKTPPISRPSGSQALTNQSLASSLGSREPARGPRSKVLSPLKGENLTLLCRPVHLSKIQCPEPLHSHPRRTSRRDPSPKPTHQQQPTQTKDHE